MKAKLIPTLCLLLAVGASPLEAEDDAVQCANLIYGGTNTSRCFSDEFLSDVQRKTSIPTERRFKSVKLASEELFEYPFVIITGENEFRFTPGERENLKKYLSEGGFLLASAGCSNAEWHDSFEREMRAVFTETPLTKVGMDHPIFRIVYQIDELKLKSPDPEAHLQGLELNGKLVSIYSRHGLNNTANTEGCCCCGGNEITNSMEVNVNVLVYALMH
ncbi:MAG: DUF4159 domain-containing protein [Verrucomicrobiota bacterium]